MFRAGLPADEPMALQLPPIKSEGLQDGFLTAIRSHVDWKMKLSSYIAKPDKSPNAAAAS